MISRFPVDDEVGGVGDALRPGYEGHAFAVLAPAVGPWVLLGELGKFVSPGLLLSSPRVGWGGTAQLHFICISDVFDYKSLQL